VKTDEKKMKITLLPQKEFSTSSMQSNTSLCALFIRERERERERERDEICTNMRAIALY
jgi:hypothetical protein